MQFKVRRIEDIRVINIRVAEGDRFRYVKYSVLADNIIANGIKVRVVAKL